MFAGGLIVSIAVLWLVAAALMRLLKFVVQRSARMPVLLRHAIANLYRPGSQATAVLIALGVGVMFTLTVFLVQRSVLKRDFAQRTAGHGERLLPRHHARSAGGADGIIRANPGTESEPELLSDSLLPAGGDQRCTARPVAAATCRAAIAWPGR